MRTLVWYLELSVLSAVTALLISVLLWTIMVLVSFGWDKARKTIKELGLIYESGKLSTEWLIKTGALPGAIIGFVSGPYLGPILGDYLMSLWRGIGLKLFVLDFSELGSLFIGIIAGIIGYLLRIK